MHENQSATAPKAAILFMIFNRPEPTRRVFETIRAARPPRLYISADAPRQGVAQDSELCRLTREVTETVDWPCTVTRLYHGKNLGCKICCSTAVSWFFESEEEGIILEDDTLAEPSFFGFCAEALERYRDDDRVMHIAGDNFQGGRVRGEGSYYFSIHNHMWGWATWRRAWNHYDITMTRLPAYLEQNRIEEVLAQPEARNYWLHHFIISYNNQIDTWDYQWTFAIWERGGVVILPNVNLVSNIGFGAGAVHCQNADSNLANLPSYPIALPLRHPVSREPDRAADDFTLDYIFLGKSLPPAESAAPQQSSPAPCALSPSASASASALKAQARLCLDQGELQQAFDLLIRAKGLKEPLEGVDQLRAVCFLRMEQPLAAVEALREEARFFPGNREAAQMLSELQGQIPAGAYGSCGTEDAEFRELLAVIRPYTMLSEQRLFSLYSLARNVCEKDLPGNFVECGVAAGGSSALLACVIKRYSRQPRRLFSFDSFSGMPKPSAHDSHQGIDAESTGWGTGTCAAPEQSLQEICTRLGVWELVTPVQGYFEETLPEQRDWVGMVSLLHLDGDWYGSTKAILDNLYDRLVDKALLQVDDYGYWDGCRKAIHEFEEKRGVRFNIKQIDGTGVWFVKPDGFPVNPALDPHLVGDFFADDPAGKGVASQMSSNERFQLYYALRRELALSSRLTRFVEIGSYSGASLVLTHQALQRLDIEFQGICVEPGGTSQFHEIVKLLQRDVVHLPMFSHEAACRLAVMCEPNRLPQFIFVDGDHTYQGVLRDILDFYPLLAPGGLMLFHDYLPALDDRNRPFILSHHGNAEPGIRQACQELMEETYACQLVELPLLYPSDPTQTQPQLPIIPGVFSTVRAYRKPAL